MSRKDRMKQRQNADLKACREYANALPLPKKEQNQIFNTCLIDSSLINPDQRAKIDSYCSTLNEDPKAIQKCIGFKLLHPTASATGLLENPALREVATCESGKKYAPTDKIAQEFMAWCLTQIPIPAQVSLSRSYETNPNWDDGDVSRGIFQITRPFLESIVKGRVYAYNHFKNLLTIGKIADKDIVTQMQLSIMPRVFFILEHNIIYLIDPIGQSRATSIHAGLFQINYELLLRTLVQEVIFSATGTKLPVDEINLEEYNIKVLISHAHPDHWAGLGQLIAQIPKKVEVLIPRTTHDLICNYVKNYIDPENRRISAVLTWSIPFLNELRKICDVFFGEIPTYEEIKEKVVFNHNLQNTANIEFREFPEAHGGSVLWLIYSHAGQKYVFLNDLFPPMFALSTSFLPHTSLRKLTEFYRELGNLLELPTIKFFGSHYHEIKDRGEIKELIPYDLLNEVFVRFSNWVDTIRLIFNEKIMTSRPGLPFHEIFKSIALEKTILEDFFTDFLFRENLNDLYEYVDSLLDGARRNIYFEIVKKAGNINKFHAKRRVLRIFPVSFKKFKPDMFCDSLYYLSVILNIISYCNERLF